MEKSKAALMIFGSLFLATITFMLLILLLVDQTVLRNPLLTWTYLVDVKSTYLLSIPTYSGFLGFGIMIIVYRHFKEYDDYGDASFANDSEIASMKERGLYENTGTILALKSGRYIRTSESLSTLIVAPQGTGKTAAMIIPCLLSDTSSFLINDIKGELYDKTSLQRSKFGRVGLFAPSQKIDGALRWNPLDKKCLPTEFDDQIDFVERIGAILYPTEIEGMDSTSKHFNAEARSIFTFWALFLINKNGGTSLPEIYMTALESGDMQSVIVNEQDESDGEWHPIQYALANSIASKGGNEYQSTVTTFKQALEPFSRPNIARNLQDCDFTHLDFKADQPFSLYLFIPANDVSRMAPIVRILAEYLVNEFLSMTDQKIIQRQRMVFAMDEFPRMGYMKSLVEAPALQRSYNMASIFVAQDKNQIEKTYGKGSFDQLVTTTDFKVIFRQNEDTTAARFSNLVGKTTRQRKSISQQDMKLLGSTSVNDEGVPLLLPQDFMNLKKNEVVILASGHYERPIKARCAWWFKDRYMSSLVGCINNMTISQLNHIGTDSQRNESNDDKLQEISHPISANPHIKNTQSVDSNNNIAAKNSDLQEKASPKVADLQLSEAEHAATETSCLDF